MEAAALILVVLTALVASYFLHGIIDILIDMNHKHYCRKHKEDKRHD